MQFQQNNKNLKNNNKNSPLAFISAFSINYIYIMRNINLENKTEQK